MSISNGISFGAPTDYFEHQKKWTCSAFLDTTYRNELFDMKAKGHVDGQIEIKISINPILSNMRKITPIYLEYWAASPPTLNQSYSGSGLPYPSEEVAFEHSPNRGKVSIEDSFVTLYIHFPNSYYKHGGREYVPPTLYFILKDKQGNNVSEINTLKLGEGIPYRTLQWPRQRNWLSSVMPYGGSLFYTNPTMPKVRTQEQILKESAYPSSNMETSNFWGKKPPM
jgi:hypothetical protein